MGETRVSLKLSGLFFLFMFYVINLSGDAKKLWVPIEIEKQCVMEYKIYEKDSNKLIQKAESVIAKEDKFYKASYAMRSFEKELEVTEIQHIDVKDFSPKKVFIEIKSEKKRLQGKGEFAKGRYAYEYWEDKKEKEKKQVRINTENPIAAGFSLDVFLTAFPFGQKKAGRCTLVMLDGKEIDIDIEVTGEDVIKVEAGRFACYKLRVKFDFPGASLFMKNPPTYWFMKEAPHILVKYEGTRGPFQKDIRKELSSLLIQ